MNNLKTFEAYFSQDIYDRKREYAARRMEKNKEIKTLTSEQHDILAELCKVRHEFHISMDNIVKTDSKQLKKDLVRINIELREEGLETISSIPSGDITDYIDIDTIDELYEIEDFPEDDEERNEWYIENYERIMDELNSLHSDIEDYLYKIDKEYGTDYFPGGHTRK